MKAIGIIAGAIAFSFAITACQNPSDKKDHNEMQRTEEPQVRDGLPPETAYEDTLQTDSANVPGATADPDTAIDNR